MIPRALPPEGPTAIHAQEMSDGSSALPFFEDPSRYVRGNPYIQYRSRVVTDMLRSLRDGSVLDVGAGSGEVTIPLLRGGNRVLFLDSSQRMIDLALSNVPADYKGRARGVCASATEFSPGETFDAVVCLGVLAHVPAWPAALERIASWITPGGTLVLQITDQSVTLGRLTDSVGRSLGRAKHTQQEMALPDVERLLAELGFMSKDSRRHCFVPWLRLLPERVARAVVDATNAGAFARRHGGEVIAAFERRS
jgi:SAM-dependent methyltransferase